MWRFINSTRGKREETAREQDKEGRKKGHEGGGNREEGR